MHHGHRRTSIGGLGLGLMIAGGLLGHMNRVSEDELLNGAPSFVRKLLFWVWDVPTRLAFWGALAYAMFWCFPSHWWIWSMIAVVGVVRLRRRYNRMVRCGFHTRTSWRQARFAHMYGHGPTTIAQLRKRR
jgi:hypothetical protein